MKKTSAWQELNRTIARADAATIAGLLEEEARGRARAYVLKRLAARLHKLVGEQLQRTLMSGSDVSYSRSTVELYVDTVRELLVHLPRRRS